MHAAYCTTLRCVNNDCITGFHFPTKSSVTSLSSTPFGTASFSSSRGPITLHNTADESQELNPKGASQSEVTPQVPTVTGGNSFGKPWRTSTAQPTSATNIVQSTGTASAMQVRPYARAICTVRTAPDCVRSRY
jgi:hypothetical protein